MYVLSPAPVPGWLLRSGIIEQTYKYSVFSCCAAAARKFENSLSQAQMPRTILIKPYCIGGLQLSSSLHCTEAT